MLPFNVSTRRSTTEIVLSKIFFQNFASKVANWILEHSYWLLTNLLVIYKDLNHAGTESRDTTYRIPALRGRILHVVSRCYVLTATKIPQVPSSVLTVLGLYSQSFGILNAVESSSNYYIVDILKYFY